MGRYAGYTMGLMEFKVDEVNCKIKPQMKDVDEALRILAKGRTENTIPIADIKKFCFNLLWNGLEQVERDEPEARKELEEFVTLRLLNVWLEVQVAFRMIDRNALTEAVKNG